jgi:uncharacterized lipoprotein YajG
MEAGMKRAILFTTALLAACAVAMPSQQTSNDATSLYRNDSLRMGGIVVPSITDGPSPQRRSSNFSKHCPMA